MDDAIELIPGLDESMGRVLGLYDVPAYVRRGLQLAHARERVFRRCETAREALLQWVRLHMSLIGRRIADWGDLKNYVVSDADCAILAELDSTLFEPSCISRDHRAGSWGIRSELRSLVDSIRRFNRRWARFLADVELGEVDAQVAAYNRNYLLEKECAMRSARLAARGFEPARELTRDELERRFPFLRAPKLRPRR